MPLEGRLHKPIQTELYLEELSEFLEETDVDCQTDKFLDRPHTPLFVPAKSGEDTSTQIYEGDLFNFDLEVIPILEVLIGKTVEQALLEVAEEEELGAIRDQQVAFEEIRQAELAEVQRLMERDRRLREEKDKRKAEAIRVAERERELAAKVAAQAFSRAYLADLQDAVFKILSDNGYFYDPVEHEEELDVEKRARILMDGLIREAVQERHYEYRRLELLEEDSSLSMAAGSALMQGSLSIPPAITENKPEVTKPIERDSKSEVSTTAIKEKTEVTSPNEAKEQVSTNT
ncbi:unnamed protein product [Echinostoma caproni]|uniref:Radial spoke head protein 3 homolog n=1 Tax=Echinostoma caproni TaxID=27848 RepID=A0A183AEZ4_9TREM|nr:unnamed protein product [Echinostoma caproni]